VLVILGGRAIGYAVEPGTLASVSGQTLGGPGLPAIAAAALALGSAIAVAVCWLAALGVRERRLLERRVLTSPRPVLRPGRVAVHAFVLSGLSAPAAGLLEAYVHWRSGLGWDGVSCVVGPVHRDLIPIIVGLALLAAALVEAAEHVLAWMRRTFALFAPAPVPIASAPRAISLPLASWVPRALFGVAHAGARAPPSLV